MIIKLYQAIEKDKILKADLKMDILVSQKQK